MYEIGFDGFETILIDFNRSRTVLVGVKRYLSVLIASDGF